MRRPLVLGALVLGARAVPDDPLREATAAVAAELGWAPGGVARACVADVAPLTVRLEYVDARFAEAVWPWRAGAWLVAEAAEGCA